MNLYSTLDALKAALNVTSTARDALYLQHIESASRRIEMYCGRVFWVGQATRYFNGRCGERTYIDDFCSLSTLAMDSELDGTFDGETWAEGTDWVAWPYNSYPKMAVEIHVAGNYSMLAARRYIKATGLFGYGDGLRATPWDALGLTATVGTDSGTMLTLSQDGLVSPGHTLVIGTEQVYVESVDTGTATVKRGVNGTTAAIHSAEPVYAVRYPASVERAAVTLAISGLSREPKAGMLTERIGDYSYTMAGEGNENDFMGRALAGLCKPI